jgi:hypothetical protein
VDYLCITPIYFTAHMRTYPTSEGLLQKFILINFRCGLTIRYISTSTRVVYPEGEDKETSTTTGTVFLCCGEKDPNVDNYYRPTPVLVPGKHFVPSM